MSYFLFFILKSKTYVIFYQTVCMSHSPIRSSNEKAKTTFGYKIRIILKTKLSNRFRHYQRSKKVYVS